MSTSPWTIFSDDGEELGTWSDKNGPQLNSEGIRLYGKPVQTPSSTFKNKNPVLPPPRKKVVDSER